MNTESKNNSSQIKKSGFDTKEVERKIENLYFPYSIRIDKNNEITSFLRTSNINYETNVDLKKKTWIHRGGIANYFIKPISIDELKNICAFLYSHRILFEIIGATSNLYFENSYNPEVVISTIKINQVEECEDMLICDCGTNVSTFSKTMVKKGIRGFEGLIDLPGTMGGSVYNNSACYKCSIAQILAKVEFLQDNQSVIFLYPEDLAYTLRSSSLKRKEKNGVILRVYLKKEYNSLQELLVTAESNSKNRKMFQNGPAHNLGSCFLNQKRNGIIYLILGTIYFIMKNIVNLLPIDKTLKLRIRNLLFFDLLGYHQITPYISEKNMNCFIWKDNKADEMFVKYRKWMKKVYKTDTLEIEIKNEAT